MGQILTVSNAIKKARQLKIDGDKIILVGGCFDILHIGHLKFLEEAKKIGGKIFVLLESDNRVRLLKGESRPFNEQNERALLLASLNPVDFVILLPFLQKNHEYDKIVTQISPNVFAVTESDSGIDHKKRQAKKVGAEIKVVTKKVKNRSTSKVSELILKEKEL